jgi:uncharacterized protein YggE
MPTARQTAVLVAIAALAIAGVRALESSGTARAASTTRSGIPAFLRFTGTGTVNVRPNQATIYVSTSGTGATLGAATDEASAAMRRVIAEMKKDGVSSSDMQTTNAGGGQQYQGGEPWQAEQDMTVTVRDAKKAGQLIRDAIAAGATATQGPNFSVSSQQQGRTEAIARAVADARSQAQAAASAAGLQLGGVISIASADNSYPVYAGGAMSTASGAPVPIQRGTQQVSASLSVTFAVS